MAVMVHILFYFTQAPSSDRFLFGLSGAGGSSSSSSGGGGGGLEVVVTSSNSSLVGQEGAEITAYDINQFAAEGGHQQQGSAPETTSQQHLPEGEFSVAEPEQPELFAIAEQELKPYF
jgi:hypothetical protein